MGSRNNKPGRIVKGTAKQTTLKDASGIWTLDEALQAHRANAWPQPDLFQPVSNSSRIKGASSAYFIRTPVDAGNRQKFTWSGWVKQGTIPNGTFVSLGTTLGICLRFSGNALQSNILTIGSTTSIALFRDPSAWYHIILALDTTQALNNNRLRMYVNGVEVEYSANAAITQGAVYGANSTTPHVLGCEFRGGSPSTFFDGQLAEINYIDGYQLTPSFFGTTSSTGNWVPIPYTGSYGTNGFYLPFTNATTSQTLGYDASFSSAPTYDIDQDPYRGSVALHLTGNGPAGGQNNTFTDSSTNNLTVIRGGTVTQGSFTPFSLDANVAYNPAVHGSSGFFGGAATNDHLQIASNSAWAFGTSDFTIECWMYLTSLPNTYLAIATSITTGGLWFGYLATGLGLRRYGVADVIQSSTAPALNTWTHLAVSRTGSTNRLFINGVLITTVTNSDSYAQADLIVGSDGAPGSAAQRWPGYISGLRITNGTAIYTSTFTPPRRPFGTATNNLLTFSENLAGVWWANNTSNTEGTAIAPDGTPSATTLAVGTYPAAAGVGSSTVAVTGSIYAKANVGNQLTFRLNRYGSGADYVEVIFNLTTGTATGATTAGTASGLATSIVNVGNGWWRCVISGTTSTTGGTVSFNPNPTSGSIFIWGAQLETGGTATNYTPTPANFSTAPSVLLNFANAAVVDSTGASNLVTLGDTSITSVAKYGSGALNLNGSNAVIPSITGNTTFDTGDFTIEFWWRSRGSQSNFATILSQGFTGGPPSTAWAVKVNGGSQNIQFTYSSGLINLDQNVNSGINPNDSAWHHIAVTRNTSKFYMFIDGILVGNYSIPSNQSIGNSSDNILVGYQSRDNVYAFGQLDDLRVTKGVARYQADFTPPARALPEVGGKSFVTVNVNAGVVQRFATVGTTSWTAPTDVSSVEVLVVAGGGAGGNNHAGGGGAGGLIYNSAYSVTPGLTYTVTVGSGGVAAGTGASNNTNGSNSVFAALTAIGGGAGGNRNDTASTSPGQTGGSGGGGGGAQATYSANYVAGLGTAGQGFAGGVAVDVLGGGGGGAGGVGQPGVGTRVGGPGLQFGITGLPTHYAGGGGGSSGTEPPALGGLGGGGTSGTTIGTNGTAGVANTGGGGGGGGAGNTAGSNGGSGVVIVRYTTQAVGNTSDATTDNLVDSPTQYGHDYGNGGEVVGNYATWNPLVPSGIGSTNIFSNGNLTVTSVGGTGGNGVANFSTSTGKWYYEAVASGIISGSHLIGIFPTDTSIVGAQNFGSIRSANVGWYNFASSNTASNTWTAEGTIIGIAYDVDAGRCYFSINGVWLNNGIPAAGIGAAFTFTPGTSVCPFFAFDNVSGTKVFQANFGQRAFQYSAPTGFAALTTKNLPRPAVGSAAAAPNQFFDTVLYTGTGSSRTVSEFNFAPDLLWVKDRTGSGFHRLFDRVRGATNSPSIYSNSTALEGADNVTFTSNGFSYTSDPYTSGMNINGNSHVVWGWRAGGAAVSNTIGTITSSVSANTASGFSIVAYSGNGETVATIGHGLGAAPAMVITKVRNGTDDWRVWHQGLYQGADNDGHMIALNTTAAAAYDSQRCTGGTSTTFRVIGNSSPFINALGSNYIAYVWAEVAGFSKFGSYTANGSVDGPFIYCGFKPRFIIIKATSATSQWVMIDTARDTFNSTASRSIFANSSGAEETGNTAEAFDIVSNGFKLRSNGRVNVNAVTHIFMAFADKPFGNVNGTAR